MIQTFLGARDALLLPIQENSAEIPLNVLPAAVGDMLWRYVPTIFQIQRT
jgi:hypothetical protein